MRVKDFELLMEQNNLARTAIRLIACQALSGGNRKDALTHFKSRWPSSRHMEIVDLSTKAEPGMAGENGSPPPWGPDLAVPQSLGDALIKFVRPAEVLSQLGGRRVPFNVLIPVELDGGLVDWVGQGQAKPVGDGNYNQIQIKYAKVAGLFVISKELARLSNGVAESSLTQNIVSLIAKITDLKLLSDDAEEEFVSPAGILASATEVPSMGGTAAQIETDIKSLVQAISVEFRAPKFVMSPANAIFLAGLRDTNGARVFGSVSAVGGDLFGIPVITSSNATDKIILIDTSYLLVADDGVAKIDTSVNASIDLSGGNNPSFSTYQKNAVAIRAERWVSWAMAEVGAVSFISGADYGGSP